MSELTKEQGKSPSRWVPILGGMLLILALGLVTTSLVSTYSTPEGMWDAPEIGVDGFTYLDFKNGKVEHVYEGNTPPTRNALGEYKQVGGVWFFYGESNLVLRLEPSLFTMRMAWPDGRDAEPRPRRRLFFQPSESTKSHRGKRQASD
jgi:hypothetical protein